MATSSPSAASTNHWPDSRCARAFWSQHEVPTYRRLLDDTAAWLDARPGERWLDLGCGCGQLAKTLWMKSEGQVSEIVGLDCASVNASAFAHLRNTLRPQPSEAQLRFEAMDFSEGLPTLASSSFDGVVSGLAIQYAEHYSRSRGSWTTEAYKALLEDIFRVLKPGGRFVFSVNVPEPRWGLVALFGLHGVFRSRHPGRFLKNSLRMMKYGRWLKQQARLGRFHYLPVEEITLMLIRAGFIRIEHRLTYARQAYLIRCKKPVV